MGTTTHFVSIETECCCACGTAFGIEAGLRNNLKRNVPVKGRNIP